MHCAVTGLVIPLQPEVVGHLRQAAARPVPGPSGVVAGLFGSLVLPHRSLEHLACDGAQPHPVGSQPDPRMGVLGMCELIERPLMDESRKACQIEPG